MYGLPVNNENEETRRKSSQQIEETKRELELMLEALKNGIEREKTAMLFKNSINS